MTKIGFILEDKPYQKFIDSGNFKLLLSKYSLELVGVFIAPDGRDSLFTKEEQIQSFFEIFKDMKADKIIILIDKENNPWISFTKKRINFLITKNKLILLR